MSEIDNLPWITDRTIEDVKFISQDTVDVGVLPHHKGALNYTDLNRINENFIVIGKLLEKYGYNTRIGTNKTIWKLEDLPYLEDINELRSILVETRNMLGVGDELGQIRFWDTLNYEDVNLIEKTMRLIGDLIQNVEKQGLWCGEVICGGEY